MTTDLRAHADHGLRKTQTARGHYSKKTGNEEHPNWVRAQIKAFTGWANSFLDDRQIDENKLGFELHDGVVLFQLLGKLEGKKIGKYHSKPKLKYHKIENLDFVLRYLQKKGEKLVSITAMSLTDDQNNLKLCLGLLWTLILRYSVKKQYVQKTQGLTTVMHTGEAYKEKDELLAWTQEATAKSCQGAGITGNEVLVPQSWQNDFQDGRVFCHLFNSIEPGIIDVAALKKSEVRKNLEMVFELAETRLKIPQLLDIDLMMSGTKDVLSTQTYVSFFRERALNPLKPEEKPLTALQKQCLSGLVHPGFIEEKVHHSEFGAEFHHPAAVIPQQKKRDKPIRQDVLDCLNNNFHPAYVAVDVDTLDDRILYDKEKKELLDWLNSRLARNGVRAENFTTSFNDPKVMCALVNYYRPSQFDLTKVGPGTATKDIGESLVVTVEDFGITHDLSAGELTMAVPPEKKLVNMIRQYRDKDKHKKLLRWVNRKINSWNVSADNFDSSWQNPLTLVALVKHFEPGRINLDELAQHTPHDNIDKAMNVTETFLEIERTMSAQVMVEHPLETDVIKYVENFHELDEMLKLMAWVNRRIAPFDYRIANFSSSFQDPGVLTAMVLSFIPGVLDLDSVSFETAIADIQKAMNMAEKEIAIIPTLCPEDMALRPDKVATMAYMRKFQDLARKLELLAWLNSHTMPQGVVAEDFSGSFQHPNVMGALANAFIPEAVVLDELTLETAAPDIDKCMTSCAQELDITAVPHSLDGEIMAIGANENNVAGYISDFRAYERKLDLLEWLNGRLDRYGLRADNFTTSFTDPKTINGLVKSFMPNDINLDDVSAATAIRDVDKAFEIAQTKMEIKRMMTAESMVQYPDEEYVFEYVAFYREYERKQELLRWLNGRLKQYNLHAENFTTSFQDPKVFSGLVKSFEPHKIKLDQVNDETAVHSLDHAISVGETECKIPRKMGPTVMLDGPDEHDMYLYVAEFRQLERKRALLAWINKRIRPFNKSVHDFGEGWKDPKILGALVASFEPSEIDVATMHEKGEAGCLDDIDKAMQVAELKIGVEPSGAAIAMFTELMDEVNKDVVFPDSEALFVYLAEFREKESKESLLSWLNEQIGQFGQEAENFTESFKNPLILNALVKSFQKDDIDLAKAAEDDPANAIDHAMTVGDEKVKVPHNMAPESMLNEPEEDRVCEYVSAFRDRQRILRLLEWVNKKIKRYGLHVDDFGESFRNPKVVCALVDVFNPSSFDIGDVIVANGEAKLAQAFGIAKDQQQINHPLFSALDVLNGPKPDDMANYVEEFRNAERRMELLRWLNNKLSSCSLHADNFTSSFQHPSICNGLVKAFCPADIDLTKISQESAVNDVNHAMDVATEKAGIVSPISPDDMIHRPQEKPTMCYVERFREEEQIQDLLNWLNTRIESYGLHAKDFEDSFTDPAILNGLVKSFEEDKIDLTKVSQDTAADDVQHAMDVGKQFIGVVPTLTAEQLVQAPERRKVCKYVQAFRDKAKERELLAWVNSRILPYSLSAADFSDSFRNTKIASALIKSFEPDAIDLTSVKGDRESELKDAFAVGKEKLKAHPTVTPADMIAGADKNDVIEYCADLREAARLRALLEWLNERIATYGLEAVDFHDSFKNPKVVAALVKSFVGSEINLDTIGLNAKNAAADANGVMGVAQTKLEIAQTVTGEEMVTFPNETNNSNYVQKFKELEDKQRLLKWVNSKIKPSGLTCKNFTDSWKDPKIVNGLIKAFQNDDIDLAQVSEKTAEADIDHAMSIGEEKVKVFRTMTATQMHENPNERRVMEYCEKLMKKEKDDALLAWVNQKLSKYNRTAEDFCESFTDSRTIACLVKSVEPTGAVDLMLTMKEEQREDARAKKIDNIFNIAEKKLNVAKCVAAKDMVDGKDTQGNIQYCKKLKDVEEEVKLLAWLNKRIEPHGVLPAKNFTDSFRDPKVTCALVKSFIEEHDISKVGPATAVQDVHSAQKLAEERLNVLATSTAHSIINDPDKDSIKEYVARFMDLETPDAYRHIDGDGTDMGQGDFNIRYVPVADEDMGGELFLAKDIENPKTDDKDLGNFVPSGKDDPFVTGSNASYFGVEEETIHPGALREPILDEPEPEPEPEIPIPLTPLQEAMLRGDVHPASILTQTPASQYDPLLNHPGSVPYDPDIIMFNYLESIRPPPDPEVLRSLIIGQDFVNYEPDEENGGVIGKKELLLFFEPDYTDNARKGMLCWNYDKQREIVPGQEMEIHHITDLFGGKQTDPLKDTCAKDAPDDCCLSVIAYINRLDVEAPDPETAERWLEGLRYLMRAPKDEILAMIALTEPKKEKWVLDLNDPLVQVLLRGKNWVVYGYDDEGQPYREDGFVFLIPEGGRLGSIHICEAGRRQEQWDKPLRHARFARITDIKGGKKMAKIWSEEVARPAHGSRCLTLFDSLKGREYYLEAQSKDVFNAWIKSLNYIAEKGGRDVAKIDPTQGRHQDLTDSAVYKAVDKGGPIELITALEEHKKHKDAKKEILHVSLGRAITDMRADMVAILLKASPSSVHQLDDGRTVLHKTMQWADLSSPEELTPILRLLLAAGVNTEAQDEDGQTAFDYATADTLAKLKSVFEEKATFDQVAKEVVSDPKYLDVVEAHT